MEKAADATVPDSAVPAPVASEPRLGSEFDPGPEFDPGAEPLPRVAAIEQARLLLADGFGPRSLGSCSDEEIVELLTATESVGRLVDAARVGLAAEVDDRSRPSPGREGLCVRSGCRTAADMIARATGASAREVARRVRLGAALAGSRDLIGVTPPLLPSVADALYSGRLGVDSAEAIVAGLSPIVHRCDSDSFRAAERALVAAATGDLTEETVGLPGAGLRFSADLVRQQMLVWQARLDPDGAAPESPVAEPRSRLGFGRLKDGVYPLRGGVTPHLRGVLNDVFDTFMSARSGTAFPSEQEQQQADQAQSEQAQSEREQGDLQHGEAVPVDLDLRSSDEKRADILRGVFDWVARQPATPSMGGAAPTVMVHVNARDLLDDDGVGWVDGVDAPVSMRTVRQMICAGGLRKIVIGDRGEVLRLGDTERCFTAGQRRAILARDGGCVIPGCCAPPRWSEVHHVVPWRQRGETDVDNGVLLCWFHHHEIDHSGWQIRMVKGRPEIKAPPWLDRAQRWRPAGQHRAN